MDLQVIEERLRGRLDPDVHACGHAPP